MDVERMLPIQVQRNAPQVVSNLGNRIQVSTRFKEFQIWRSNKIEELQISIWSRSTSGLVQIRRAANPMREWVLTQLKESLAQTKVWVLYLFKEFLQLARPIDQQLETLNQLGEENSHSTFGGDIDSSNGRDVARHSSTPSHYPKNIPEGHSSSTNLKEKVLYILSGSVGSRQDSKDFLESEQGDSQADIHLEEGIRTSRGRTPQGA